ncbi:ATP-binding protein [Desulforamulus aeronauticus]|uniref:Replicative DNA helicase loader DnaI n=1 Tax=Desulforamulus aeronauticus DSM 10349 TaxID=1121421 RepID=A0A1M6UAE6_9FIRM|nr:ATP-binding protein [Desulforamulus aeronauticus]SHK66131.1 replicative DNA helicase loader DnaI [Desulforamulus aeronauticus DSM 10349]
MDFFDPEKILKQMSNRWSRQDDNVEIKSIQCEKCEDRGLYMEGEFAVPCICVQRKALENKFRNCQIPKSMLKHSFNNFKLSYYSPTVKEPLSKRTYLEIAQRTLHYAEDFAKAFVEGDVREGLLLQGQVGSGKTFLACCIANYVLQNSDKAVLFVIVPDLLEKIKASYSNVGNYTEYSLVEAACEVPLLIMDDLGAHNYTEWTKNKIYNIINHRVNQELPTIITTNLDVSDDLVKLVGERTVSRIEQMCYPLWLEREYDIREVIRQEKINQHISGLR